MIRSVHRTFASTMALMALIALPLLGSACGMAGAQAAEPTATTGPDGTSEQTTLFLNITSGKSAPHPVVMALTLASEALGQGKQVVVFFNVAGADVPTQSLPPELGIEGISVKRSIEQLIQRGAMVLVCGHCMHYLGIDESALMPGVVVADAELLFARIGPSTVALTY